METLHYLQDSRNYVGNSVMWWGANGGYTSNLLAAQLFTEKQAMDQHKSRPSDIPWPVTYVRTKMQVTVDHQYLDRKKASIK